MQTYVYRFILLFFSDLRKQINKRERIGRKTGWIRVEACNRDHQIYWPLLFITSFYANTFYQYRIGEC